MSRPPPTATDVFTPGVAKEGHIEEGAVDHAQGKDVRFGDRTKPVLRDDRRSATFKMSFRSLLGRMRTAESDARTSESNAKESKQQMQRFMLFSAVLMMLLVLSVTANATAVFLVVEKQVTTTTNERGQLVSKADSSIVKTAAAEMDIALVFAPLLDYEALNDIKSIRVTVPKHDYFLGGGYGRQEDPRVKPPEYNETFANEYGSGENETDPLGMDNEEEEGDDPYDGNPLAYFNATTPPARLTVKYEVTGLVWISLTRMHFKTSTGDELHIDNGKAMIYDRNGNWHFVCASNATCSALRLQNVDVQKLIDRLQHALADQGINISSSDDYVRRQGRRRLSTNDLTLASFSDSCRVKAPWMRAPWSRTDPYIECGDGLHVYGWMRPYCLNGLNPGSNAILTTRWYLISLPRYCNGKEKANERYGGNTFGEWYGLSGRGGCVEGARYLIRIMKDRWTYGADSSGGGTYWWRSWGIPYKVEWTDSDSGNVVVPSYEDADWSILHTQGSRSRRYRYMWGYGCGPPRYPLDCPDAKGHLPLKPWDPGTLYGGGRMTLQKWWKDAHTKEQYALRNGGTEEKIEIGCIGATGAGCKGIHGTDGSLAHDMCVNHYVSELDRVYTDHKGSRKKMSDWLCGVAACWAWLGLGSWFSGTCFSAIKHVSGNTVYL